MTMFSIRQFTPPGNARGFTLVATASNGQGDTAGPFMAAVPSPPASWSTPYAFSVGTAGVFTISATGDGVTVSAP